MRGPVSSCTLGGHTVCRQRRAFVRHELEQYSLSGSGSLRLPQPSHSFASGTTGMGAKSRSSPGGTEAFTKPK